VALVRLEKVTKRFHGAREPAVVEVSFAIEDGEFMVILGPSGCGKSTTLRMLAGLESITSGTIAIDGRVVNDVPAKDRDIAMVFQSYALYPHMTVARNLAFGLLRRRIGKDEINRRVADVSKALGLSELLDRKPFALSGGQRQRVALGRAIVRDPKVFLFDEPLSNLDAALRVSTRNELVKLHQRLGATMIYVTHDQIEAMTMGDRICIMDKGRVVQVGRPLDVYLRPANAFVARFLGNPPMNMLPGTVAADGAGVDLAGIRTPAGAAARAMLADRHGQQVTVGIRPEDLRETRRLDDPADRVELPARVVAVEPLGAETLLVLAVEGVKEDIIARVGRDVVRRVGDPADVGFTANAVRLFDPRSGEAIDPREQPE
jgi:multiple sugar transport system ATP-binding protein